MADDYLRNSRTKNNRTYSEAELALFAEYVERRAACRPFVCTMGPRCWVKLGPPGMDGRNGGTCVECDGLPRA